MKGGDYTMDTSKLDSITNKSLGEFEHQLRKFQADFEKGVVNPESMSSFSDMERHLESLVENARKTYLDTLSQYLSSVDERALIKSKKENTGERGSF